jgi:hypothetical protein
MVNRDPANANRPFDETRTRSLPDEPPPRSELEQVLIDLYEFVLDDSRFALVLFLAILSGFIVGVAI